MNLTLIIKGFAKPNEVPSVFGFCPIIEDNDLMYSSSTNIKNGDLLFFKKSATEYKLGATDGTIVAIMTDKNIVIVRRLIGSRTGADGKEIYIADADNKSSGTRVEASADEIVGVYAGRMAGMGTVVLFSHRPIGTLVIVVLPILLLCIAEYFILRRNYKKTAAQDSTSPVAVICNPYVSYVDNEKIIAEYEAYVDDNGKEVVKRVKNKNAAK